MPNAVIAAPYDPEWQRAFKRERDILKRVFPTASAIEHIGSTSVPGLIAKPIIDILVVLDSLDDLQSRVAVLTELGYVDRPDAFPDDPQHRFFRKDTAGVRTHHLHVFADASPRVASNRNFRDFLVATPESAAEYGAVKIVLANMHPHSRGDYARAKQPIMDRLLREAEEWARSQGR